MPKYKAYIDVYHVIRDIEADDPEHAKEQAIHHYIWDDFIMDSSIVVEEIEDGN